MFQFRQSLVCTITRAAWQYVRCKTSTGARSVTSPRPSPPRTPQGARPAAARAAAAHTPRDKHAAGRPGTVCAPCTPAASAPARPEEKGERGTALVPLPASPRDRLLLWTRAAHPPQGAPGGVLGHQQAHRRQSEYGPTPTHPQAGREPSRAGRGATTVTSWENLRHCALQVALSFNGVPPPHHTPRARAPQTAAGGDARRDGSRTSPGRRPRATPATSPRLTRRAPCPLAPARTSICRRLPWPWWPCPRRSWC